MSALLFQLALRLFDRGVGVTQIRVRSLKVLARAGLQVQKPLRTISPLFRVDFGDPCSLQLSRGLLISCPGLMHIVTVNAA